jgi:hypothetical protein
VVDEEQRLEAVLDISNPLCYLSGEPEKYSHNSHHTSLMFESVPGAESMSSTSLVSGSVPAADSMFGTSFVSESVSSAELTSGTFLYFRPCKALLSKIRLGDILMYIVALPIFTVVEVSRLHQTNFLGCTGIPSTSVYGSPYTESSRHSLVLLLM